MKVIVNQYGIKVNGKLARIKYIDGYGDWFFELTLDEQCPYFLTTKENIEKTLDIENDCFDHNTPSWAGFVAKQMQMVEIKLTEV